jgi:excisionase family DNA binding protein
VQDVSTNDDLFGLSAKELQQIEKAFRVAAEFRARCELRQLLRTLHVEDVAGERVLSVRSAAKELDVSPQTVLRRVQDGSLRAFRNKDGRVRIKLSDVRAFNNSSKKEPGEK